ncbi:MAG: 3-hydroxyacyl-ACP dehydratase FabZ [Thermoanaerobaculia bacterium]
MLSESSERVERDIGWIMSILPHRYPFLLVDRVLEFEAGKRLVAIKNFTINEEFFVGHFPNHPVVPGVLLIEGMAQAGGLLALAEREERDRKLMYFAGIDRARFRKPVVPGDQVRFEIEMLVLRSSACRLSAQAKVDGKVAAEAVLTAAIVDR